MSGPDIERVEYPRPPDHAAWLESDLDAAYVARLADQTKVDRGSVALVLGQHFANQHALEHARPGRPAPFGVNMNAGTLADASVRTPLTDEELVTLARETEGL